MPFLFPKRHSAAILASVAGMLTASADAPIYPTESVVLFVAAWCGPCHAEIDRLDEIEAVARPRQVRVVAYDDDRRTEAMLRRAGTKRVWRPAPGVAQRIRSDVERRTSGLPFSLATDSRGRVCGETRRGLTARATQALIAGC